MTFDGMILVSSMALLSFSVLNLVNVAFHCRFSGPWWAGGPGRFGRKTERYFKILTSFEIFLIFPVRQFEYTMC